MNPASAARTNRPDKRLPDCASAACSWLTGTPHPTKYASIAPELAVGIAAGLLADRFVIAQTTSPTRTMLLNVDMADMGGKETKMWITAPAPGAVTPKHYHPGHVVAYVLEGAVIHTVEVKSRSLFGRAGLA